MSKSRKLLIICLFFIGILSFSLLVSQALEYVQKETKGVSKKLSDYKDSVTSQVIGEKTENSKDLIKVAKVVDGDTIQLEDGQTVRYIGINTPETVDPRRAVQCFGHEASNENKRLIEGKLVRLEKDVSETDKYGRLLRYVFLKDENDQEIFINDYLVRNGFARASSYPPDVKYQTQFREAEKEAREESRGLWKICF